MTFSISFKPVPLPWPGVFLLCGHRTPASPITLTAYVADRGEGGSRRKKGSGVLTCRLSRTCTNLYKRSCTFLHGLFQRKSFYGVEIRSINYSRRSKKRNALNVCHSNTTLMAWTWSWWYTCAMKKFIRRRLDSYNIEDSALGVLWSDFTTWRKL